jgi:hypothetical protein
MLSFFKSSHAPGARRVPACARLLARGFLGQFPQAHIRCVIGRDAFGGRITILKNELERVGIRPRSDPGAEGSQS